MIEHYSKKEFSHFLFESMETPTDSHIQILNIKWLREWLRWGLFRFMEDVSAKILSFSFFRFFHFFFFRLQELSQPTCFRQQEWESWPTSPPTQKMWQAVSPDSPREALSFFYCYRSCSSKTHGQLERGFAWFSRSHLCSAKSSCSTSVLSFTGVTGSVLSPDRSQRASELFLGFWNHLLCTFIAWLLELSQQLDWKQFLL